MRIREIRDGNAGAIELPFAIPLEDAAFFFRLYSAAKLGISTAEAADALDPMGDAWAVHWEDDAV